MTEIRLEEASLSLNYIRILKTGLYGCERYLDMEKPENRLLFEQLAASGTELKLKRVKTEPKSPWKVEVYSMDDRYLGKLTRSKSESVARLMDAGLKVIAIVNQSLTHNSDYIGNQDEKNDVGWTDSSREDCDYGLCNLPYGIYLQNWE